VILSRSSHTALDYVDWERFSDTRVLTHVQPFLCRRIERACVIVRIMVSVKIAAQKAMDFAQDALGAERTAGLRLEEVESTTVDSKDAWLITLSMLSADGPFGNAAISEVFGKGKREYKTFTVLKRDGEVKAMKIRELAGA
jgi:hypothetical protein